MYTYALKLLQQPTEEPFSFYTFRYEAQIVKYVQPAQNISFIFRDGYEKIWRNIADKEGLDIRFNQEIYAIRRKFDKVILKIQTRTSLDTVQCGFLIWAAPITPEFLRFPIVTF